LSALALATSLPDNPGTVAKHRHKKEQWEGELTNRQRNIVFPDTVRNGRSVDALLWKGNPHATRVQRIGIAIFAAFYLIIGVLLIYAGSQADSWDLPEGSTADKFGTLLLAAPCIYLGGRMLRNTFLRPPSKSDQP
jgi:hypothetical protein